MTDKNDIIVRLNRFGKKRISVLFIINFDLNDAIIQPIKEVNSTILFNINGIKNYTNEMNFNKEIQIKKYPIKYEDYFEKFNMVKKQLMQGNSYLLNLTQPTKIELNENLLDLFYNAKAKYKLLIKNKFVVFSPESFIKINANKISSYPMKGTIDAGIPDAANLILSDEKEHAEHITIVDLIRNDLSIIADNVIVEKFRYIDEIKTHNKTLLQVSSKITGELKNNWHENLGHIIISMLPAGSVTGAPKKKTVEIIKDVEKYDRGFYTGIFGYYDGNNVDSAVMIRFIENIEGVLYYKSGGGITIYSDPIKEYNEMVDKIYVPVC
jgi:para-aminobenzoate synthetase component 1